MKRFYLIFCIISTMLFVACSGGSKHDDRKFAGTFVDEFENKFVLNDNYTGTIQFAGNEKVENVTWFDGEDHKSPFATISYNGEPAYYFLRDGYLYRHRQDMETGHCAIKIEYQE